MPANLDVYRQARIDLYLRLPDTPPRLSRFDLRLVRQLWERQVPLRVVEMACWLASARRAARPAPRADPLAPLLLARRRGTARPSAPAGLPRLPAQQGRPAPCRRSPTRHPGLSLNSPNRPLFKFIHFYMRADILDGLGNRVLVSL